MQQTDFDVLIVGAGLSGIGAAYHLQARCPSQSFAILEARERMGGTWDLFRYPGVRSDSDMYTLGYSFRPWTKPMAIADGPSILAYVRETAEAYGIDRKIRYRQQVRGARWSSASARWTLEVHDASANATRSYTCRFLLMCAGYYDYERGYTPEFRGIERFRGQIVHPQHWPRDLDYAGKHIVVIGSGATAVTLVPELAKQAAHVTMLQRSPTYVLAVPERDALADWLREHLPSKTAYALVRWKNVLVGMGLYAYCRKFPERAKQLIVEQVRRQIGTHSDVARHFSPAYKPWDQRLCLSPEGDLFRAIRRGAATVVTDRIDRFTERGLRLASGAELEAEIVVTATGLNLKFLGGLRLEVDGQPVEPASTTIYRGMMCSDVPNLAFLLGYTNASWTLKCDLSCEYLCRLLNHMKERGYAQCCPRKDPSVRDEPLLQLTAGYVQRSQALLPRQGDAAPWKLYQNYVRDRILLRQAPIEDGVLEFERPP